MKLFERFREDIKNFLKLTGMPPTLLSIKTMKDRNIVGKWLDGQGNPTVQSMQRVYDFMMGYKK